MSITQAHPNQHLKTNNSILQICRLSFTNQQLKALQNIYPKIAQSVSLRHRFILNKYTANQLTANGSFYFRGCLRIIVLYYRDHLRAGILCSNIIFRIYFRCREEYSDINFPRMWRAGVNYHFPILCGFWLCQHCLFIKGKRQCI